MTELDLEAGKTLLSLIKTTEKALENLNNWLDAKGVLQFPVSDKGMSLIISESKGDIGFRLDLNRSAGNPKLLILIKEELESQLAKFKSDFESL